MAPIKTNNTSSPLHLLSLALSPSFRPSIHRPKIAPMRCMHWHHIAISPHSCHVLCSFSLLSILPLLLGLQRSENPFHLPLPQTKCLLLPQWVQPMQIDKARTPEARGRPQSCLFISQGSSGPSPFSSNSAPTAPKFDARVRAKYARLGHEHCCCTDRLVFTFKITFHH